MTLQDEARDAARSSRRFQAHPDQPPIELWTTRDTVGFLLALAGTVLFVVFLLAMGGYPA